MLPFRSMIVPNLLVMFTGGSETSLCACQIVVLSSIQIMHTR